MESSFLSEVHDTSILRTGALHRYHYLLTWLPASRLLPPRSGLERSDFVLLPVAEVAVEEDIGIEADQSLSRRPRACCDRVRPTRDLVVAMTSTEFVALAAALLVFVGLVFLAKYIINL